MSESDELRPIVFGGKGWSSDSFISRSGVDDGGRGGADDDRILSAPPERASGGDGSVEGDVEERARKVNGHETRLVIKGLEAFDHLHSHVGLCCRPLLFCANVVASTHTRVGKP